MISSKINFTFTLGLIVQFTFVGLLLGFIFFQGFQANNRMTQINFLVLGSILLGLSFLYYSTFFRGLVRTLQINDTKIAYRYFFNPKWYFIANTSIAKISYHRDRFEGVGRKYRSGYGMQDLIIETIEGNQIRINENVFENYAEIRKSLLDRIK
ncbi:MAG: hypothetical protein ACOVP5_08415 [Chitinophagales bacterium]